MSEQTHYDVLGITSPTNDAQVRAAYRKLVRTAHPDVGGDAETFHRVQAAFEGLKDANARALYDRSLAEPAVADEPFEDIPEWGTSAPLAEAEPIKPAYVAPLFARTSAQRPPKPKRGPVWWVSARTWSWLRWTFVIVAALVSVAGGYFSFVTLNPWWPLALLPTLWLPIVTREHVERRWIPTVMMVAWFLIGLQELVANLFPPTLGLLLPLTVFAAFAAMLAAWWPSLAQWHAKFSLARQAFAQSRVDEWTRVQAAVASGSGTLYWIKSVKRSQGGTECQAQDPVTGEVRQLWVKGEWKARMWIVVSGAVSVIEYAWEDSRTAAGGTDPFQKGAPVATAA